MRLKVVADTVRLSNLLRRDFIQHYFSNVGMPGSQLAQKPVNPISSDELGNEPSQHGHRGWLSTVSRHDRCWHDETDPL